MLTKLSQAITITGCLYLIMSLSQVATVQPSSKTTLTRQPIVHEEANQVKPLPRLVEFVRSKQISGEDYPRTKSEVFGR